MAKENDSDNSPSTDTKGTESAVPHHKHSTNWFVKFTTLLIWLAVISVGGIWFLKKERQLHHIPQPFTSILNNLVSSADFDPKSKVTQNIINQVKMVQARQDHIQEQLELLAVRIDNLHNSDNAQSQQNTVAPLQPANTQEPEAKVEQPAPPARQNKDEILDYDQESLSEGLSEINNKTVQLEEQIYALNNELQKAKKSDLHTSLLINAVNLRDSVNAGKNYHHELEMLKKQSGGNQVLNENLLILTEHVKNDVPNLATLTAEFDTISAEALNVYRKNKTERSFLDNVALKLSNMISIRKTGNHAGQHDTESTLARAEHHLLQGQLYLATAELAKLEGSAKSILEPWIERAQARLTIENATAQIYKHIADISYYQQTEPASAPNDPKAASADGAEPQ